MRLHRISRAAVKKNCLLTSAKEWTSKKHLPTTLTIGIPLNELANEVLDGDKLLKHRQLIQHPDFGKEWSFSSANEFGRLAQRTGGRINGTSIVPFLSLTSL